MADFHENNIEWLTEVPVATASFTNKRFINRVKKLAENDEQVTYEENADGSIVAHFPVRYIKIYKPTSRELTEEEKEIARDRLSKIRSVPHA